MAINEGFKDGSDRAEELERLKVEQMVDSESSCGVLENELLFDPRILNRWSERGRIEATGTPGLWRYKF